MNKQEKEIKEIFDNYNSLIIEKLISELIDSYGHVLNEVERRGLIRNKKNDYPRLNYFLRKFFLKLFEKLHRGEEHLASDLIQELKIHSPLFKEDNTCHELSDFVNDDRAFARFEYDIIIKRQDKILKSQIKEIIMDCFNKAVAEINSKNIAKRSDCSEPRLEDFIKIAFSYLFSKLHKGEISKAQEIIDMEMPKLKV